VGDGMDDGDITDFIPAVSSFEDYVELERSKHKLRAERFGIEVREPKLAVIANTGKKYINTRPEITEEEKRKKELRALRFGLGVAEVKDKGEEAATDASATQLGDDEMMDVDIREERQDVNLFVPRRLDSIHVYGTDDMDTNALFEFFKDYNPKIAEWINDSSCNIVFKDTEDARRALEGKSKPMENFASLVPEGADEATINKLNVGQYSWREGLTLGKKLLLRVATTADIRPSKPKPSVFYKKLFDEKDTRVARGDAKTFVKVGRSDSEAQHRERRNNKKKESG